MNNKLLVIKILSLFFISINIYSQRFEEVIKWEVKTKSGGIVFGIGKHKKEIDSLLDSYSIRNAKNRYGIDKSKRHYTYTTIPLDYKNEKLIETFKSLTKEKGYKVISIEDLIALDITKNESIYKGIKYYAEAKNVDFEFAKKRITHLEATFKKYMLNKHSNYTMK